MTLSAVLRLASSRILSEPTERGSIGCRLVLHDGPIVRTWVYMALESVLRDTDGNTVMVGSALRAKTRKENETSGGSQRPWIDAQLPSAGL